MKERKIRDLCVKQGYTVAAAESCTGGLLSDHLTNVPGSSEYFMGGVIAYNNDVKINILRVPFDIIYTYGAVSGRTALAMAKGVKKLFDTDIGIGITGICGPTGGTTAKPVGLVFVGGIFEGNEVIKEFYFEGDRLEVKTSAVNEAVSLVLELLGENTQSQE
ncbi:MAG: CinA family protein [Candidatus Eremiobacteraeota bacterium]|nr:CinA family protein [Candidatus Eremiobacteraeota bacterium]